MSAPGSPPVNDTNSLILLDESPAVDSGEFFRIESNGAVEPGFHWLCRTSVEGVESGRDREFAFQEGMAYLLTRLVYFDGKLHSVELLDDPSSSEQLAIITLPLLFEHFEALSESAANDIRQQQMLAIQHEAAEVQKEMTEATVNPALLEPVIRDGLQEWERELARNKRRDDDDDGDEPASKAQLPAVGISGQFNLSGAVTHRITSNDIEVFRHMAQREGKIAEIRGKWLSKKVEQLGRVLKKLAPFYSEHAAIGMARAHEALTLSKEVEKGLRSLRLYTGEGVEVVELAKGPSAPSSEPLTVYQRKLYMDEEFAAWDEVDRMFDYGHSELFFTALRENPDLREQLIPARRGVVGMAIRRTDVNYDAKNIAEAMAAAEMNRANKALFLLVRDGDNWYQVFSSEPSHELSPRLFPTRNEMDHIFAGLDGEQIGFEDLRFTNRTTEYDRKALSYKRFLILACGLDHRCKLFGDFYPERESLSFISVGFQAKYMKFVADDDSDFMLGDNVGDVHDLIAQNQGQLAAGCRVIVFCEQALHRRDAAPGAFNNGSYEPRRGTVYTRMVRPQHKAIMATVRRDKDDLVVMVPVERINDYTRSGWGRSEPIVRKNFSVRVALNKVDNESIAYLITDTLRAEELRPYIYSRAQRASHWDYIYGFKLTLKMLGDEERSNAPVLAHMQSEVAVKFGLPPAAAAIAATSATQAWRLKNPDIDRLPSPDSPGYTDVAFQLAEAAYAFTHAVPLVDEQITALGGRLIRVMRGKKGTLIAYYEQPESEKDARIQPWGWVGRRVFTAAGKPTKEPKQSVWMRAGRITGEYELFSARSEFAQTMPKDAGSLAKLITMANMADSMAEILAGAFTGERQGVSDAAWAHLTAKGTKRHRDRFESSKTILLPLAVDTSKSIIVGVAVPVYELLHFYGSDAQRGALREMGFTLPKPRKDENRKVIPYDGPRLSLYVDQYVHLDQYVGPVGQHVSISSFRDFELGQWNYEGENKLDHGLDFVLQHSAEDSEPGKSHWERKNYLNGNCTWMPKILRNEDGSANVSKWFPGLTTA